MCLQSANLGALVLLAQIANNYGSKIAKKGLGYSGLGLLTCESYQGALGSGKAFQLALQQLVGGKNCGGRNFGEDESLQNWDANGMHDALGGMQDKSR
ncbi:hypothetical protein [Stenotrophomonas sp. NPDC078853]|uniref:hypothetical protein n=1 Tax=Stenotrophomonas sp. NPDC078853 TaxID=3364534 RepID=UPI00384D303C